MKNRLAQSNLFEFFIFVTKFLLWICTILLPKKGKIINRGNTRSRICCAISQNFCSKILLKKKQISLSYQNDYFLHYVNLLVVLVFSSGVTRPWLGRDLGFQVDMQCLFKFFFSYFQGYHNDFWSDKEKRPAYLTVLIHWPLWNELIVGPVHEEIQGSDLIGNK